MTDRKCYDCGKALAKSLVADSSRITMSFFFKEGSRGIADGVWSMAIVSSTP